MNNHYWLHHHSHSPSHSLYFLNKAKNLSSSFTNICFKDFVKYIIPSTTSFIKKVFTMKVHPGPIKLQRLPHVFAKVLQLPFHSNADISIQETSESFLFMAKTDDMSLQNVRADVIEIYPGVMKVVIKEMKGGGDEFLLDAYELNLCWFRLPDSTRPEMTTANCFAGELVITVPKSLNLNNNSEEQIQEVSDCGEMKGKERLVLVEWSKTDDLNIIYAYLITRGRKCTLIFLLFCLSLLNPCTKSSKNYII